MSPNENTPDESADKPRYDLEEEQLDNIPAPTAPEKPVVEEAPAAPAAAPSLEPEAHDDSNLSEQTDEPVSYQRRVGVNPNATLTRPVTSPLTSKHNYGPEERLAILGVDAEELDILTSRYPNVDFRGGGKTGQVWVDTIIEAQDNLNRANALLGSLTREDSQWAQEVTVGAVKLSAGLPKFGEGGEGGRLTGELARMKLRSVLGLGAVVRVPLYHSGVWVSLKAPNESALLELDRRLANEKIMLGRVTNGLIFSNSSIYNTSFLVNFALAHIYEVSYKYTKIEELKNVIRITDIPTLLWGLLCTIYPAGYPYKQPCVNDPSKCQHIVEEILNLGKLSWTDDASLSDWQRQHMLQRTAKYGPEEIKRYQEEHGFNKYSVVKLNDRLSMELRVPTIAEAELSGFAWVDGIVRQVDQAFGGTIAGAERNNYINEQGQMTALRQYAHWVNKLVMTTGEGVIDEHADIEDAIGDLTADPTIFTNFFDGIGRFIDRTTISLIAIPRYNCPSCDSPMSEDEKHHPHLIALDVANIFFTLQGHRISQVLRQAQR